MESAINIEDVSFQYKYAIKKAIDKVSLSIGEREFVGIFGASGSGKTTLVRTLNRIVPAFFKGEFSGQIKLRGIDISHRSISEMSKELGMLFQDFESQLFSTNIEHEIVFGCENLGVSRSEMLARLKKNIEFAALSELKERDPSTLSGGEKQRLAIASILAMETKILILDEPTSDLDPLGKESIFKMLFKLKEEQRTIILIEHETEEAFLCDRVIILDHGKAVAEGTPYEILLKTDFLIEKGIKPPDLSYLSSKLFFPEMPHDIEEAFLFLKRRGHSLNIRKYQDILIRERKESNELAEEIMTVKDLHFAYEPGREILSGIDLSIRRGEFIALLGANGSGKTTLVKHFNGLLKPSAGKVFFKGQDISDESVCEMGKKVGYIFQNPDYQIFSRTVEEEIAFGPRNFGFSEEEVILRVGKALKIVGLERRAKDDPFAMTKGERQKIAVASIIASSPEVIIMDEPTTGLDYNDQIKIMSLLKKLNESGHTIIIITHSIWLAAEYARRVLVMEKGKIIKDDSPRNLFADDVILQRAQLKPPKITQLGKRFGVPVLSVREFIDLLK